MALIDELKAQREKRVGNWDARQAQVSEHQAALREIEANIADLDRAIAALETVEEADAFAAGRGEVKTVLLATGAANAVYAAEDEVFADAYAAEIISDLTGDPAIEPESGLHGEAVSEEGYAPVTNPEADAIAQAQDWYSPEQVAEREKASRSWSGMGSLWGKPKVDA